MKHIVGLFLLFVLAGIPVLSEPIAVTTQPGVPNSPVNDLNPLPATNPSVSLAAGTSKNVTVTTTSQSVSLTAPSMNITLNNTSASNTLYFNPFGGAASASNFPIMPGQAFVWGSRLPLSQFTLYASGSGTVVGILAH